MKRRSFAKQRDRNEPEIVEALRKVGCKVYLMDEPVDLLVGVPRPRSTVLLEVKDGSKPPADRELKPSQVAFFRDWNGGRSAVVRSAEEALCVVGLIWCRERRRQFDEGPTPTACGCGTVEDPEWFTARREQQIAARAAEKKATRAAAGAKGRTR